MLNISRFLPLAKCVITHRRAIKVPTFASKTMFSSIPMVAVPTVPTTFPIQTIETMADVFDSLDVLSLQQECDCIEFTNEMSKVLTFIGNDEQKIQFLLKDCNKQRNYYLSKLQNCMLQSCSNECQHNIASFFADNRLKIQLEQRYFCFSYVGGKAIGRNFFSQYVVDQFTNLNYILSSGKLVTDLTIALEAIDKFDWSLVKDSLTDKNTCNNIFCDLTLLPVQKNLIGYLKQHQLADVVRGQSVDVLSFLLSYTLRTHPPDFLTFSDDILEMNVTDDDKAILLNLYYETCYNHIDVNNEYNVHSTWQRKQQMFGKIAKHMEIARLDTKNKEYCKCFSDTLFRIISVLCNKPANIVFMGRCKAFITELLTISENERVNMKDHACHNRRRVFYHLLANENNRNMIFKLCENQPELIETLKLCQQ